MNNTNDNIYLDLAITNLKSSNPQQRIKTVFNLNSSQNILNDTTGYKLSVIRFNINTSNLPIWIPLINDINTNTTDYSISIAYVNTDNSLTSFNTYMIWIPQNTYDVEDKYYCYTFQYIVDLLNSTISTCLQNLKDANSTNPDINNPLVDAPVFSFDTASGVFSLKYDNTYFGFNEIGKFNIYFNSSLGTLLGGFNYQIVFTNSTYNQDYQIIIDSNATTMVQEYSTKGLFNPISMIVLTSNLLPIYNSNTPPINYYSNGNLLNNSSSYDFTSILTDFVATDLAYTPFLQYAANPYRYIDLKVNNKINNIDVNIFWVDRFTGKLNPVYLPVGCSSTIKIMITNIIQ
jgi:hypothetical protein